MPENDSSSWEDSSDDKEPAPAKQKSAKQQSEQTGKTEEPKMTNADADSWEEEPEVKPVEKEEKKVASKKSEWDDDQSASEDEIEHQPKAKSSNKSKLLRDKLRAREAKSRNDYDDQSASEEEVDPDPNAAIGERTRQNQEGNLMLFGKDKGVKKKKKTRKLKVPESLKDLYPVNSKSRLEAKKDLKRFSDAISSYILDLSLGGESQTGTVVKASISPNQAKNFVCTIISKCCDSLDFTQLADIRRQVDSQMTKFKNAEMAERKRQRRGVTGRPVPTRKIFVEKNEDPVYLDGSYNDTDFDAFY